MNKRAMGVAIYESAPRVNPSFMSCAAPAGAAVVELRYTTTEPAGDRATLESDLSAAPEAEMGLGSENFPGLPIRRRIPHLCTKALNSGVWGRAPEIRSCRNSDQFTSLFRPFARTCQLHPVSHLSAFIEA